jgi:hypothetical protein
MNYEQITNKYLEKFKSEYRGFVMDLIADVEKEIFSIDYSIYTSKTVEKPTQITKDFLKSENIQDHRITNVVKSFDLDLSFYLEMISYKEREELNAKLFNKITEKNKNLNK